MKVSAFTLIISVLAMVGCKSSPVPSTDTASTPAVTTPDPVPKPEIATGYNWRSQYWGDQDFRIVELEVGNLQAHHLAVCASSYAIGKLSNRLADECDRIAAKGLVVQRRRAAQEKIKDDAYDEPHPRR